MSQSRNMIDAVIALILFGTAGVLAFQQMESWSPTDPTMAILWPIIMIVIGFGFAMKFYSSIKGGKG